ncbi:MAG TPA: phosphatidylinositol-specific phospholipase C/glycerophosphodiester phosphodiesterase family protein [Candidatus Hydrogenedentes bacterium]|nr:phosphatidylinositol-specific phospholipase C/glycerophosphodiester phosphodiesterase family protein [Candidatus Hydrogenedentota bacterium]
MILRTVFIISACAFLAFADVVPLPNAHAHNDYEHERPLLDALDHGFCSVEADIFLVDGKLLVAHDAEDVKPERTLQALYLDPLRERVRKNGGRVYPNGPTVWLFIDIKDDGVRTYEALKPVLNEYEEMLTVFADGKVEPKAVTVVLSGASPRDVLKAEPRRLAAIDGRLRDLEGPVDPSLTPIISDSWAGTFRWNRSGAMPEDIYAKLKATCDKAHQAGVIVRFWAIPHREDFWATLMDAGVDLINADDLARLQKFLASRN